MMDQILCFRNALFLLFCLAVNNAYAVTNNFLALSSDTTYAQQHNTLESESNSRAEREVSFSTSSQGRVPSRVRFGIPKVTVTQREVRGALGSNVTLECFVESFPKSTNFWIKGDLERLESTDKYKIIEENFRHIQFSDRFRLQIINVEEDDIQSKFRCIASNEYGTDTGLMQISAPRYLETNQFPASGQVEAHLRARVVLECEVKGYPLPVTYWFRKSTGEQLLWSDDYHVTERKINSLHYVSQLHIRSIAKIDFTTFVCVSKNTFRQSENTFQILEKSASWFQTSPSSAAYTYPGMWLTLLLLLV